EARNDGGRPPGARRPAAGAEPRAARLGGREPRERRPRDPARDAADRRHVVSLSRPPQHRGGGDHERERRGARVAPRARPARPAGPLGCHRPRAAARRLMSRTRQPEVRPVTLERRGVLLDAYGAAAERWPDTEREAARWLIPQAAAARARREEAAGLDRLRRAHQREAPPSPVAVRARAA